MGGGAGGLLDTERISDMNGGGDTVSLASIDGGAGAWLQRMGKGGGVGPGDKAAGSGRGGGDVGVNDVAGDTLSDASVMRERKREKERERERESEKERERERKERDQREREREQRER